MLGMTSIRSIGSVDVVSIRCVPRLITCAGNTANFKGQNEQLQRTMCHLAKRALPVGASLRPT